MATDESGSAGRWICVDGVEGVGKTTISRRAAAATGARLAPEFSTAGFGRALADAVRDTPHFISTDPVGQSLVFIGDFYEVHASEVAPRLAEGTCVISDRGYLSKYAYQEVVLSGVLGRRAAGELLDAAFAHLRRPDLTVHLVAPPEVLRERLVARDGTCDDGRLGFMVRAFESSTRYLARTPDLATITVDADRPVDVVASDAVAAIAGFLAATRHR